VTLDSVLRQLPRQTDPNVLVVSETSDDAGVYLLDDKTALVQTVDFLAHYVDDPRTSARSRPQIPQRYLRHGGRPISSLSIVAFRKKAIPKSSPRYCRADSQK